MRSILLKSLICVFMFGGSAGATILCADQSNDATGVGGAYLSNYIALGSTGCVLDNVTFANFAYSYTLGTDSYYVSGPAGTGSYQDPSVVGVSTGVSFGPATTGQQLTFGANWVVNGFQTANLSLSFTVSAPPSDLASSLTNVFTGTKTGTGASATYSATCTGGTCGSPTTFTNSTVSISPTTGLLTVTNTAFLNADGQTFLPTNNVHLSILSDGVATVTPEPMSYALTGFGLIALASWRRRKSA